MNFSELSTAITDEIRTCLEKTDETQLQKAVDLIDAAPRVFLAGAGRTGLEVSSFAMRLMHIGYHVHRVGEVTTPAIQEGDLLVLCSGSGETKSMIVLAETARKVGASILLFTTKDSSTLAEYADQIVVLYAKSAKAADTANVSIQPMSNLFVQSVCITFDMIIIALMDKNQLDESKMKHNHTNLE